jgi:hypothetical protein
VSKANRQRQATKQAAASKPQQAAAGSAKPRQAHLPKKEKQTLSARANKANKKSPEGLNWFSWYPRLCSQPRTVRTLPPDTETLLGGFVGPFQG